MCSQLTMMSPLQRELPTSQIYSTLHPPHTQTSKSVSEIISLIDFSTIYMEYRKKFYFILITLNPQGLGKHEALFILND